jgi:hypothetical protein
LIGVDDFVENVGNFAFQPDILARHPDGKITAASGLKSAQQILEKQVFRKNAGRRPIQRPPWRS